ncbi:hypothetical protein CYMTET_5285 [Cymbomonas tetramitiformis]|uniref:Uncharacterized protein n=1 Tax=Cymbomonas tetramitiformis TaxID=36881 RepID=A0AAE0LJM0_9CHLO|nr:hypothetical protein CYMTET_5285 [Cymbomonas tetramitiformis]
MAECEMVGCGATGGENAAMRMYTIKNNFKNSEWGILATDWLKLPEAQKAKYRMNPVTSENKAHSEKVASLAAECQGMRTD